MNYRQYPLRVWIISSSWPPLAVPAAFRMDRLATELTSRSVEVAVISSSGLYELGDYSARDSPIGGKKNCAKRSEGGGIQNRPLLMRMLEQSLNAVSVIVRGTRLRSEPPDIVVVSVPAIPIAFSARVLAYKYRVPLVVDLRDAWPDLIADISKWDSGVTSGRTLQHKLAELIIKVIGSVTTRAFWKLLTSADQVITTSSWLEQSLKSRGLAHVRTIRNSPVRSEIDRVTSSKRQVSKPLRLLYAGTIGRAQGIQNLIDGVVLAGRQGNPVNLKVVGDGAEANKISEKLSEADGQVVLLERVPFTKMSDYYAWCDVAVVHLRDWEPLTRTVPSKLIEIMDRKIPVLLVGKGESAEIVRRLNCGFVAPPEDPIALASVISKISDSEMSGVDLVAAEQWVESNCNPQANAEEFANLVENCVG